MCTVSKRQFLLLLLIATVAALSALPRPAGSTVLSTLGGQNGLPNCNCDNANQVVSCTPGTGACRISVKHCDDDDEGGLCAVITIVNSQGQPTGAHVCNTPVCGANDDNYKCRQNSEKNQICNPE
jgi:hypothetical protein